MSSFSSEQTQDQLKQQGNIARSNDDDENQSGDTDEESECFDDIEKVREKRKELNRMKKRKRLIMAFDLLEESVNAFDTDMAIVAMEFGARLDVRKDPTLRPEVRFEPENLEYAMRNTTVSTQHSKLLFLSMLRWAEVFHSQVASGQIGPLRNYPSQEVIAMKKVRYYIFLLDTWVENMYKFNTDLDGRELIEEACRWGDWGQTPPSIPQLQIIFKKVKKIFFNTFDDIALKKLPPRQHREFASLVLVSIMNHGRQLDDDDDDDKETVNALVECVVFCLGEGASQKFVDNRIEVNMYEFYAEMERRVAAGRPNKEIQMARYRQDPDGDLLVKTKKRIGSARVLAALCGGAAASK